MEEGCTCVSPLKSEGVDVFGSGKIGRRRGRGNPKKNSSTVSSSRSSFSRGTGGEKKKVVGEVYHTLSDLVSDFLEGKYVKELPLPPPIPLSPPHYPY